jgi:UDP-glucose 6-dehydrogenase
MPEKEPIGVIGAGWVGLVTAACFAELGHEVHCRDIVAEKIESLRAGQVPIYEPDLSELIERNTERLDFTTDMGSVLENAQLLFCCVDTPPTYSGDADLSRVQRVIEEVGDSRDHALVMKSTVPVGTGRSIARDANGLGYVSNPEFLKEGSAVSDFMEPDRVVVGVEPQFTQFGERVAALYESLDAPVIRTDVASAEMIKLASNAFLATKISFINEIANVSEELGADVAEVARGMGLDERIGPKFLQAGIGYGGSCLVGSETVLVRRSGRVWMWTLEEMFERLAEEQCADAETTVLAPRDIEVLCWGTPDFMPQFLPVALATRRLYEGTVLEVRTESGEAVRCTPDHPFLVADSDGRVAGRKLAYALTHRDHLPVVPEAVQPRFAELVVSATVRAATTLQRKASRGTLAEGSEHVTWTACSGAAPLSFKGHVYSIEVPGPHTFVTTGGLVTSNCFPKDVSALKQLAGNSGYHFQLLTAVIEVNELQKRRTIGKLQKHLGSLVGKEVALLGVAFKPDTDDVREATSLVLAARLQGEGANVRVYDPVASANASELLGGARICESALEALDGADAAVLVTEWPEFAELDWAGEVKERMASPVIVDGRNFLDAGALKEAGFAYEGVGRS